jgi:PleD family two-component response regulator
MRVLVGWDSQDEAEAMRPFLNVGRMAAVVITDPTEFELAAERNAWDVILMALSFPSEEKAYTLFEKLRSRQPDIPIIGGCYAEHDERLAKFLSQGLHNYVTRDADGDFILLIGSLIESAYLCVYANRSRHLTERLREAFEKFSSLNQKNAPRDVQDAAWRECGAILEELEKNIKRDGPPDPGRSKPNRDP